MIRTIRRMRKHRDDTGASAVEYGLLVAAIAAGIVAIVFALGTTITAAFQHTSDCIAQGTGQPPKLDAAGNPVTIPCN